MPQFAIVLKDRQRANWTCITGGENSTDALLTAYKIWAGEDRFQENYEEEGSGNALAEQLLAEVFDCTEIHRAMVLEYVERKLDGDQTITIIL
ncbi:hypothetical protein [Nitrospira sp. BLG_2]|uniref:hypothetical protein n=1 Tax=Nitrospira sp. BLG_2 TaxID=3397507 RepID=UPI003B9D3A20